MYDTAYTGAGTNGEPACVVLCGGSDCAEDERAAHRKLRDALRASGAQVRRAPCLGVCHGPVAVVDPGGDHPVVLRRIKGGRRRRAVARLALTGLLDDAVADRAVTGKRARRAVRRASASR